jgi:hypothetical protein
VSVMPRPQRGVGKQSGSNGPEYRAVGGRADDAIIRAVRGPGRMRGVIRDGGEAPRGPGASPNSGPHNLDPSRLGDAHGESCLFAI